MSTWETVAASNRWEFQIREPETGTKVYVRKRRGKTIIPKGHGNNRDHAIRLANYMAQEAREKGS